MSLTIEDAKSLTKEQLIEFYQKQLQEKDEALEEQKFLAQNLQEQLDSALRRIFGRSTEKLEQLEPGQMYLFQVDTPKHVPEEFEIIDEPKPKKKPKRKKIVFEGPVEEILITPEVADLSCDSCHSEMETFGDERTQIYEYIPAKTIVKEIVRPKYACRKCQNQVVIATMPSLPIPRSNAGYGLLSHILVSKYQDHLPLNRLCEIFKRHGMEFKLSTMSDWMMKCAELLKPIVDYMKEEVLKSEYIYTDDTTILVLGKKKDKTKLGRLWVYLGDDDHPYNTFEYSPNRKGEHPQNYLQNYKGFIHADAYAGYNPIYKEGATEVACWAHTRRKFFDAFKNGHESAKEALEQIAKLYLIEREGKLLSPSERKKLRQEKSKAILANFKTWLQTQKPPSRSDYGRAVTYATNQWEALNAYTMDGKLNIDNNPAEQSLRFIAIGRKNWLFAGSDRGGHAAATICSLMATCKRHKVDPYAYIHDALTAQAKARDSGDATSMREFTPLRWKELRHGIETEQSS